MIKKEVISDVLVNKESFSIISNDMIADEDLSDTALSIYVIMRTVNFDVLNSCSYISASTLTNILNIGNTQSSQLKDLYNAIVELEHKNYIELYDFWNLSVKFDRKSNDIYKVSFLHEDENNGISNGFTKIPEVNLLKILKYFNQNKGIKKYQFIKYYLLIARSCSNDGQLWSISQKQLAQSINISRITCNTWTSILQDIGVIFYNNEYGKIGENGSFKYACTIFFHRNNNESGYKGKVTLESFADIVAQEAKSKNLFKLNTVTINNKRSETMKKIWADRKS